MNDSNGGNNEARRIRRGLFLKQAIAYLSHLCDTDCIENNSMQVYGKPLITLAFPSNDRMMHEVFLEDYLTDDELVEVLLDMRDKLLPHMQALEADHE